MTNSIHLGISFSSHHAQELGLDPVAALEECCTWPISSIRLGAYWSQLEPQAGEYDFSPLTQQLEMCFHHKKQVILTVGAKAPRWPEFYFPPHVEPDIQDAKTQAALLRFIEATVLATRKFSNILLWQVENEPLDPSGPAELVVPTSFLQQESKLIRHLDPRPQMITVWGNNLMQRGNVPQAEQLGDVVGIDLYYKQFVSRLFGKNLYRGPLDSDSAILTMSRKLSKPLWIAELQAEPWEHDHSGYLSSRPGSMSVKQLQSNWERAKQLPVHGVLFWGAEYWLWQESQGNTAYIDWLHSVAAAQLKQT